MSKLELSRDEIKFILASLKNTQVEYELRDIASHGARGERGLIKACRNIQARIRGQVKGL